MKELFQENTRNARIIMSSWKKIENQNGLPFYLNETTEEKQWYHPKFNEIRQQLDDCNYVKYSTYRVALKFRVLQQSLNMDQVPLTVIAGVFERHKLGINEFSLYLDCYDLEAILFDIYFACNKQTQNITNVDVLTELMLNLLLGIYDRNKTGKVQVLSVKILLGILSSSTLNDLFRYLFELCADHNNCITRLRMQIILKNITDIINFLHEDANFGQHLINTSVENCFANSPGLVGITGNIFISWLQKGPPIMAWLQVLSRIKLAETVLHNNVCSSCKLKPFAGLRYRCLKCTNFVQCQKCFFTGKTTNSHKPSHSMREHCGVEENNNRNYIFFKKIFRVLKFSSKNEKSYIPATDPKTTNTDKNSIDEISTNEETNSTIVPSVSPLSQLQLVIRDLEQQNGKLNDFLKSSTHSEDDMKTYLKNHRSHVSRQIHKLKLLMENLKSANICYNDNYAVQSTPMISNGKTKSNKIEFDILSPIVQVDDDDTVAMEKNMRKSNATFDVYKGGNDEPSTMQYSLDQISTWMGNRSNYQESFACQEQNLHTDLDDALAKLQQILANNYTLEETLGNLDNGQLKYAVSEVEGMLTSFIDTVETNQISSIEQSYALNKFC